MRKKTPFLTALMLAPCLLLAQSVCGQKAVTANFNNPATKSSSFVQINGASTEGACKSRLKPFGDLIESLEWEDRCAEMQTFNFQADGKCLLNKTSFPCLKRETDEFGITRTRPDTGGGFRLRSALVQSGLMLGVQHGFRLFQKKTRRELGGPFFRDWGNSVKGLRGWRDGDNVFTNYFAHPLQGGVTGRIYLTNSPEASRARFGKSARYWKSRFDALLWSAFWSTQFELGPVSEATIGNVGLRQKRGVSTMGYVDLVMTPSAGTGIIIGEDIVEKYVLDKMLRKNDGRANAKIKILRTVLTPTMSLNNLLRGKMPWKRDAQLLQAGN